tara:strand:+ start:1571 stop:2203 length:633 start_codon:yes stop_codon:yes gene_type:complete
MASGWDDLSDLGKFGVITQGFSAVGSAVGSFYAASGEKYKTKSLALSLEHKKDMALFNKRMKESMAWHLNDVYNRRLQILGLKQGDVKSKNIVSIAARGGVRGVGSNLNAMVSNDVLAEIDKNTLNSNKVRAIQNKRLEGAGVGIQASMYGLSASNAFATASNISPFMNMSSSLLTGAGNFVSSLPEGMLTKGNSASNDSTNSENNQGQT